MSITTDPNLALLLETTRKSFLIGGYVQTKEQQVAEFLRGGILGGFFLRGQKLKQAEIAELLNLSITPVREALKILEAEGYIQVLPHRGAVVATLQIERVDELYNLRIAMEPKLTFAATTRLTDRDLAELVSIDDTLKQAVRDRDFGSRWRAANFPFHFRLYECADMPQTLSFVRVLWAKYPFDMIGSLPKRADQMVGEHDKIIQALVARDSKAAMRAMQDHIEEGYRLFKANYSNSKTRVS